MSVMTHTFASSLTIGPIKRDRCEEHCAQYGDPPCWKLPSKTSDWPKDRPVRPCIDCSDANNEETENE